MDKKQAKELARKAMGPASHWNWNPAYPKMIDAVADAILEAVEEETGKLREAIRLLNSMVESGERHTSESRQIVKKALSKD